MRNAVSATLYSEMTRYIESQIAAGVYRPNDRLPPLREWAAEFHLTLDATRRGMWHLRDKGLLDCRRGAGVFVRGFDSGNTKERTHVGLVFATNDPNNSYCAHVLLGIRQAGKDQDIGFHFCRAGYGDPADPFRPLPELNDFPSVIMLGNYDRGTQDYAWLRRPAVGVEMHRMYGGLFSVVSMDPVNAAELAADYFLKHGKKHVKVLDFMETPLHRFRAQVFDAIFRQAGGTAEPVRVGHAASPDLSRRDCGYLCTGGTLFQSLALEYPGDLAHERCILSLDAKSEILPGYSPVTTIGPDWRQIGVLALEEAVRRGRNPGSMGKRIYADVRLIER